MNVRFIGSVISGKGRGSVLGFPTLNLKTKEDLVKEGVYAVKARVLGKIFDGVMHVGPRPTFYEDEPSIEVHLLNYQDQASFSSIEIEILGRLREVQSFDSSEALKKQIKQDIMNANVHYFKT